MLSKLRLFAVCGALMLFVSLAHASIFSPFLSVLDSLSQQTVSNQTFHELAKRAVDPTSCPTGYKACSNIGAPGLCCANSAVCAADQAGHVACCPSGAACTGSISSVITSGVIASGGSSVSTTTAASKPLSASAASSSPSSSLPHTTSSGSGLIVASGHTTTTSDAANSAAATTTDGFILVGSSTAATLGSNAIRNLQTVSLTSCQTSNDTVLIKNSP